MGQPPQPEPGKTPQAGKGPTAEGSMENRPADRPGAGRSRWAYAALGSELAGSVLVPVLLGLWADRKFGWQPWGVVAGATLGMIAAGSTLARLVLGSNPQPDRDTAKPD